MTEILIDYNMEGQAKLLWSTITDEGLLDFAPLRLVTFAEVGLPANSSDRAVWRFAQAQEMLLLTANRNARGENSLGLEPVMNFGLLRWGNGAAETIPQRCE